MLRLLLRSLAINIASVYIAVGILSGIVTYIGGIQTLLMAGLAIALGNLFVRPVINLLLLPVHLVTLGIFRWVSNVVILYLVTRFVSGLNINSFTFPGFSLPFLIVPPINFSAFGSFIFVTFVFTIIFHFLYWLFQD